MAPREVFYVMGHGKVESSEVLNHRQRLGIPIVFMGTQGQRTYPCPSVLLISYYMKIHGIVFMNELFSVLHEYGENYKKFKPNVKSKLEMDIRFLLDVNQEDQKHYPQNVLRAYTGTDTVLNSSLVCSKPFETFFYDGLLSNKFKTFLITKLGMESFPHGQYSFHNLTYKNKDQFFSLVNPFGIFKFEENQRTFEMKHRFTQKIVKVNEILQWIRSQTTKIPIVFMIHCKEPDKEVLMDFDFYENPIEKLHKKTLLQMMQSLTLKTKTPTKTKTKTPTKTKTKTPPKPVMLISP